MYHRNSKCAHCFGKEADGVNRKSEEELQHIIRTYGNLLYRNAYVLLGNPHDVQDVLQEVLLKYME